MDSTALAMPSCTFLATVITGWAHPDDKVAGNVNDVVLQRHADAAAQVLLAEDRR